MVHKIIPVKGWVGWGKAERSTKGYSYSVPEYYFYLRIPVPFKRFDINLDDMTRGPHYWVLRFKPGWCSPNTCEEGYHKWQLFEDKTTCMECEEEYK